ncbi:Gfo/Idh/MocA family oxidoreductase [Candidatus Sumerlaeota bacterium]|nr:Gfo/Idh/MocA family oxidoreductase [Candidatus Sumerlaeota bacterium]
MNIKTAVVSFEHMHACGYAAALESSPKTAFVAFAEDDPVRYAQIRKLFPKAAGYKNIDDLLKKAEFDAVVITSANARHKDHAVKCARAGKHILCEKPIATTLKDAKAIIEESRKAGVNLQTAFPVRYSPAIQCAKTILADKKLGQIMAIKTTNHGSMPGGWFVVKKLSGGGAIMDHTVHVADLLRYLLEEEFTQVYAEKTTRIHTLSVEDCGLLMMKMSGGAFVSLDTSWSRSPSYKIWGDVTLEFKGTEANLSVDCFPRALDIYQNATMKHSSLSGGDNLDLALIEDFAESISSKKEPFITGEDGYRALELAIAAYQSIKDRNPVNLPL